MWLIELGWGQWQELTEWEVHFFEEALEQGHNVVEYTHDRGPKYYIRYVPYEVDVINKTQKNMNTGKVRKLMRIMG